LQPNFTSFSRLVLFTHSLRLLIMDNFFSAVPKGAFFVKRFGASFGLFVLLTVLGVDAHAQKKTTDSRGAQATEMPPGSNWPHFPTLTEDPPTWPGHSLSKVAQWVAPEQRLSDWAQDTLVSGDSTSGKKTIRAMHPLAGAIEMRITQATQGRWVVLAVSMTEMPFKYIKTVARRWEQTGRAFNTLADDQFGYTYFQIIQFGTDGMQFGVLNGGKDALKAWNPRKISTLSSKQKKKKGERVWMTVSLRFADEMLPLESLIPAPNTPLGEIVAQDTSNRAIGAFEDGTSGLVQLEKSQYSVTWVGGTDSSGTTEASSGAVPLHNQPVNQVIWSVRPPMRPYAERWLNQQFPQYLMVDDDATYFGAADPVDGYRRMALVMHDERVGYDLEFTRDGSLKPLLVVFLSLPESEFESFLNELMELGG
jgi:hypothetical protein